ncbi:MAG TPA: hypothetical protein DCL44_03850 [Elusimicrobia bacterium]|nr:hypothetical protein [Elusimicrobiota bacterium]
MKRHTFRFPARISILVLAALLDVFSDGFVCAEVQSKNPASSSGTNWVDSARITDGSDDLWAAYAGTAQDYFKVTNFNFSIPIGAVINGLTVTREGNGTGTAAAERQYAVGLTKNSTSLAGTAKTAQDLPKDADDTAVVGASDDLWQTTWSPEEVNNPDFGIILYDNDTASNEIRFDSVTVSVFYTVGPSIEIVELSYDFSSLYLGVSSISATAVTVKNDGNVTETFWIRAATVTAGSPWFLSTDGTPGINEAVLEAVFHDLRPENADFGSEDLVTTVYQTSQTGGGGNDRYTVNGSSTGVSVPVGQSRSFWFRFTPPQVSSATSVPAINVYIKGVQ